MNYFEFGAVIQEEASFKIFLIYSSGGHFDRCSQTYVVEGIMRNISMKLF